MRKASGVEKKFKVWDTTKFDELLMHQFCKEPNKRCRLMFDGGELPGTYARVMLVFVLAPIGVGESVPSGVSVRVQM